MPISNENVPHGSGIVKFRFARRWISFSISAARSFFAEVPLEAKRRLLDVVIEETCYSLKRGEKTGEILYMLR